MGLPAVTQTWTFSPNNRYVYSSASTLITTMGALIFSLKGFLKTTMGYTVKGSCDGTTGAMDGVDRITSAASWGTRFNGPGGAMSWLVLTDGAGIDWCFAYNSTSDDVSRLSHSTGGNYVAAGTPNQMPTATDECFDSISGTWINATTSADRVWHMWGSSDKKMWRLIVCRSNALVSFIAGEKFTPAIISPTTFALATGGGTVGAIKSFYTGTTLATQIGAIYAAGTASDLCRLHAVGSDINVKATWGGEYPGGSVGAVGGASGLYPTEKPPLQGGTGELIFPVTLGSIQANSDGKLGNKIDHWFAVCNNNSTPGLCDVLGTLQFVTFEPGIILPWDGVTVPVAA